MKRVYMILICALLVVPMTACGDDNGTVGSDLSEKTVPPDEGDSGKVHKHIIRQYVKTIL